MNTRWERGHRCWGLWSTETGKRVAFIGLPPFGGQVKWSIDGKDIDGYAPNVVVAKRIVKEVLAETSEDGK